MPNPNLIEYKALEIKTVEVQSTLNALEQEGWRLTQMQAYGENTTIVLERPRTTNDNGERHLLENHNPHSGE